MDREMNTKKNSMDVHMNHDSSVPNNVVDRTSLLNRIGELEFAALDIQLYLNTHPCDKDAIEMYNLLNKEALSLRNEYEKSFAPLFSYYSPADNDFFSWVQNPWSWDKNYSSLR